MTTDRSRSIGLAAMFVFTAAGLAGCATATGSSGATTAPMSLAAQASSAQASATPVAPASATPVPSASTAIGSGEPISEVEVAARDLAFTPTHIEIPAVGSTRIVLRNKGIIVHNFTVEELGIAVVASRGGVGEAILIDPPPGTYTFYCSVSGHRQAGMVGTLVVS
jgi:nitrite reductase (NO-forming)